MRGRAGRPSEPPEAAAFRLEQLAPRRWHAFAVWAAVLPDGHGGEFAIVFESGPFVGRDRDEAWWAAWTGSGRPRILLDPPCVGPVEWLPINTPVVLPDGRAARVAQIQGDAVVLRPSTGKPEVWAKADVLDLTRRGRAYDAGRDRGAATRRTPTLKVGGRDGP